MACLFLCVVGGPKSLLLNNFLVACTYFEYSCELLSVCPLADGFLSVDTLSVGTLSCSQDSVTSMHWGPQASSL